MHLVQMKLSFSRRKTSHQVLVGLEIPRKNFFHNLYQKRGVDFALSRVEYSFIMLCSVLRIEDCAKDGGDEFFTEKHCVRVTNL